MTEGSVEDDHTFSNYSPRSSKEDEFGGGSTKRAHEENTKKTTHVSMQ